MSSLIKISYKNTSGVAVPPYGCIQFSTACETTATNDYVVKAIKPNGIGPYAIDDGKGTSASGAGQYGTCMIPYEQTCWVSWSGAAPTQPWTAAVGPQSGQFTFTTSGSGYLWAGAFDTTNQRALVIQTPVKPGVLDIRFLVVSSNQLTALGKVISWDSGYTETDVPGDIGDIVGGPHIGVVEICDPTGCFFNEPSDRLFARQGSARYRSSATPDLCRTGYPPYPPAWEVYSLCCAKPLCSFIGT